MLNPPVQTDDVKEFSMDEKLTLLNLINSRIIILSLEHNIAPSQTSGVREFYQKLRGKVEELL